MAKYSYHRLDANHREIRSALEAVGATVNEKGPLDLLVGFRGTNYLLEVKTAKGKLRASQKAFLESWRGKAFVVRTIAEAFAACGIKFEAALATLPPEDLHDGLKQVPSSEPLEALSQAGAKRGETPTPVTTT